MPRFAATQDRVNRACIRHLADASALLGSNPVEVLFYQAYTSVGEGIGEVASSSPMVRLLSSQVPANVIGLPLQILQGPGLGNWRVEESQPDGAGMTLLLLEKA